MIIQNKEENDALFSSTANENTAKGNSGHLRGCRTQVLKSSISADTDYCGIMFLGFIIYIFKETYSTKRRGGKKISNHDTHGKS